MKIHGLGGTVLQPSIDFVEQHYNEYNTVVLSDGYTDNLDISRLRGNVLMISVGVKMPIARSNGKLKQIVLEGNE
jgi:predicted metal-dependent peptidase